jgi:hypothetical protein
MRFDMTEFDQADELDVIGLHEVFRSAAGSMFEMSRGFRPWRFARPTASGLTSTVSSNPGKPT